MAAKKTSAPRRPTPPRPPPSKRNNTIEVDAAWLDQLPEDEKPRKRSRPAPPPAPPPASVPRPPPRPPQKGSGRDTIPVQSEWLLPPLPDQPKASRPPRPPPPPAATAVKPRGKLPPPLPRDDGEDEPKK